LLSLLSAQVGQQAGAECIPLILEPQSAFFTSPVVVLDFQSLYPSILIAYNICYSTCLGRADRLKDKHGRPTDRFGFSKLELEPGALQLLEEYITSKAASFPSMARGWDDP
jgi:DNA polymerase zeta